MAGHQIVRAAASKSPQHRATFDQATAVVELPNGGPGLAAASVMPHRVKSAGKILVLFLESLLEAPD